MYKNKITLWGLDKKQKRYEACLILRRKREWDMQGRPPCLFLLRGWLVDMEDLERYRKRAKLQTPVELDPGDADVAISHGAAVPRELLCITASEHGPILA